MFKFLNRLFHRKSKVIPEDDVEKILDTKNCSNKNKFNQILKMNLDNKKVCITDFENTHFIMNDYLNDGYVHYVFTGPTTHEFWLNYKRKLKNDHQIYEVYSNHIGKNFVDNNISLYVGLIFGLHNIKGMVLVSDDNDYKIMAKTLLERELPFELIKPGIKEFVQKNPNVKPNFVTESYLKRLEKDIVLIMGESTFISTNALNKIIRRSRCVPLDLDEIKYIRSVLCQRNFLVKVKNRGKESYKIKRKREKTNKNWNQDYSMSQYSL